MAPVDTEGDNDTVGDIPAEDRECSSGSLHNPIPGQASVPESKINIRESHTSVITILRDRLMNKLGVFYVPSLLAENSPIQQE